MKIAVTGTRGFPGVQGGIESHCEHLYTRLAEIGCDITVFTRKSYVTPNIHSYKGVSLVPVNCPQNKFLEAFVHTFRSVLQARKLKPDILHIHAIGPSLFAPVARVLGMKVVVTTQGSDYRREKWPFPAKMFLRFCEWIGITFAHEVIAVASYIAEDIKRKFGRNVTVIPNGSEIFALADTEDILKKFSLQKRRYILAVGRFVPEKGFHHLINAFNDGDFKEWKLVIAGGADHEDRYSMSIKEKADKNTDIILTGFLTGQPLKELYSHAGLFVLSSHYEGLSIVLLEAMSYGLSCIASDISANRSMELSGDRYFKAGDVNQLRAKIKEFINEPWGEEEGEKQIKIIAEKYNWDKIAEQTLEVYKRVVN